MSVELRQVHPWLAPSPDFASEVVAGLASEPKTLPSKYFYDRRGSALFERITTLPDYYLTRAELQILALDGRQIAHRLGPRCLVIEPGSGSGRKSRLLLWRLEDPVAYIPVEVPPEALRRAYAMLRRELPRLEIFPVCADFTAEFELPPPRRQPRRTVLYLPGSTLGNFELNAAAAQMRRLTAIAAETGAPVSWLIGIDLKKDPRLLACAYNDRAGVTAAFNLNLLARLNRELGADFALERFAHEAFYNERFGRIEMHLRSDHDQIARVAGRTFHFAAGETILTELSYKYDQPRFRRLAAAAGLQLASWWTDPKRRFAVSLLEPN